MADAAGPDSATGKDPAGAGRPRRLLLAGGWVVAALAAFAVYLRLADTRSVNSDVRR